MKTKKLQVNILIIFIPIIFCFSSFFKTYPPQPVHQTYYVDATLGNDSNDGLNREKPWKTLSKVNHSVFNPGDKILLKRGETFDGELTISASGDNSANISYDAYGEGSKPIISGLTNLTQWKNLGKGIWEAECTTCQLSVNMVLINNKEQGIGRYPNPTDNDGGYLNYESHINNNTIVSKSLNSEVNYTGAEAVVRRTKWILEKGVITSQVGQNITYKTPSKYPYSDGFGYFIQNDPRTLDQLGEWYYNPANKTIQIYFGTENPKDYQIEISKRKILATIYNVNYVTVENICFKGANETNVAISKSTNIQIKNNQMNFSGKYGILAYESENLTLDGNNIDQINDTGIKGNNCLNAIIHNNNITNIGLIPGMGSRYSAVEVEGNNMVISFNNVDKCGYDGFKVDGNDCLIKNNFVNRFTELLDDGGGIYLDGPSYKNRKVINNIITNGIYNSAGTNSNQPLSEGIYADDSTSTTIITGNTIANMAHSGIKIHNAHMITVKNNTLFNNQVQIMLDHDRNPNGNTIRNLTVTNNIMVSVTDKQNNLYLQTSGDDIANYGSIDSNYYVMPEGSNTPNITTRTGYSRNVKGDYDLKKWNSNFSFDRNSIGLRIRAQKFLSSKKISSNDDNNNGVRFEYNSSSHSKNISLGNSIYVDLKNKKHKKIVTIAPYSSIVLLKQ